MSNITARQIQLIQRPAGTPTHEDFRTVEVDLGSPQDGQIIVKNHYMSVDPYMRGRMRA